MVDDVLQNVVALMALYHGRVPWQHQKNASSDQFAFFTHSVKTNCVLHEHEIHCVNDVITVINEAIKKRASLNIRDFPIESSIYDMKKKQNPLNK